jgi:putative toxin-antitoxin system antitoxin component (TIGR02293 family)
MLEGMSEAEIEDPMETALRLGLAEREAILRSAEPYLKAAEMARAIGTSTRAVYDRVRKGKLLAIKINHLWKLPAWQVKDGRLLPGLEDALAELGEDTDIAAVFFFESPNIFLDERTPEGSAVGRSTRARTWSRPSLRQTRSEVSMTKAEANKAISLIKIRLRRGQLSDAMIGLIRLLDLEDQELSNILQVPRARLHKIAARNDFTSEELARISRLMELIQSALRVLGNVGSVKEWLRSTNPAMANRAPSSMINSDSERTEAERVLGRIEYGVFS